MIENEGNADAHHVKIVLLTQMTDKVVLRPDIAETNAVSDYGGFASNKDRFWNDTIAYRM